MLTYITINFIYSCIAIIIAEVIGNTFTYRSKDGNVRIPRKESKILFSLIFAIFGTACFLMLPQAVFRLNTVIVAAVYMAIYYSVIYFIIGITGKLKKKSLSR